MKSVLFISLMNGASWGGSEELWFQTALYAAGNGYKTGCAFYDWPQKKERIEQLKKAGCQLYLFSNKGRQKSNLLERLQYKITKRKVRRLARFLPFAEYDITVINLGYLEVISHYWKDLYKYIHDYALLFHVYNKSDRIKPKRKALLKKWLSTSTHNLFASARIKTFLEEELNMAIPKVATLFNPLTFSPPNQLIAYPPLKNGKAIFVMLATLEVRRKAQDNLIKALSSATWKERAWELYLYGSGESEKSLQKLIDDLHISEKIFLKGHTSDVKAALAEAHVLLQMTHIDAMPLAVVEALAMAKPLVVSDIGDMPQWVSENDNGWISENASVEAITESLEKAWQNRERWEEMGKQSYRLFVEKFPAVPEDFFLKQLGQ